MTERDRIWDAARVALGIEKGTGFYADEVVHISAVADLLEHERAAVRVATLEEAARYCETMCDGLLSEAGMSRAGAKMAFVEQSSGALKCAELLRALKGQVTR